MPSGDGTRLAAERAAAAREADPRQQAHADDTAKWGAKVAGIHANMVALLTVVVFELGGASMVDAALTGMFGAGALSMAGHYGPKWLNRVAAPGNLESQNGRGATRGRVESVEGCGGGPFKILIGKPESHARTFAPELCAELPWRYDRLKENRTTPA